VIFSTKSGTPSALAVISRTTSSGSAFAPEMRSIISATCRRVIRVSRIGVA
jgi:hypothetical protein